jgi:hypothetical protein
MSVGVHAPWTENIYSRRGSLRGREVNDLMGPNLELLTIFCMVCS